MHDLPHLIEMLFDDHLGKLHENPDNREAYERAFKEIEQTPNVEVLLGLMDEEIVAMTQVAYIPNLSYEGAMRAEFDGVRVKTTWRHQGLGKKLFQEGLRRARERGCAIAQLTSNHERPKAIAFYEKLGFLPTHVGFKLYFQDHDAPGGAK